MTNLKKSGVLTAVVALFFTILLFGQVHARGRAEAGIIEVESGFVDAKGTFWKMRSGSGFLISNKENATYVVTNSSNVSNTPGKIKKFCKKHGVDTENMQLANTVRVVVTRDVTAIAEVVVKSAERDYCVLSVANVASQKESLKLGNSAEIEANAQVYAYGFPRQEDVGDGMEYSQNDVRSIQGVVAQTAAYKDNGVYLAHSAPVIQGQEGGPLLDVDGYVIGLNCKQSPEEDTGIAYALPIDEISSVLDNFSIYYGSRAIDEALIQLSKVYQECESLIATGDYKKASIEKLEQTLAEAGEVLKLEEPEAEELKRMAQSLSEAKDMLEPKTKALTIFILIFAVCDLLLFIMMIILAIKNAQEKKQMEMQRVQPAIQGAGYDFSRQQPNASASYPRRQQVQANESHYRQPVAPPAGRRLRMIRQKTGQTIVLNKNQFIIGKSQTMADFALVDNQTISRKHAMLYEDNGSWYVDDLNSLNGTRVNGTRIVPGQPVKLKSGDEVTMSDEAFLVQN